MSLCLLKATKNEILIAADSRASKYVDGQLYKDNDNCKKITVIHNKVIFTCGVSELLDDILNEYEAQSKTDLYTLYYIAKPKMDTFKINNPEFIKQLNDMFCGIIVAEFNNYFHKPIVHIISDDYEGIRSSVIKDNCNEVFEAFGIKTIIAKEMISKLKEDHRNICELFQDIYNELSFEGIGGTMTIYQLSQEGISKYYENPIIDNVSVRQITNNSFVHRIWGDKLVISEDNFTTYKVLLSSEGLNLENFALTNRITIAAKPYEPNSNKICGGFRIQKNTGTYDNVIWDDVFYIDLDGNIHMKDSYIDMESGINRIYIDPMVGIKVKKSNEDIFYIDPNTGELYIKGNLIAGKIDINTDVKVGNSIQLGDISETIPSTKLITFSSKEGTNCAIGQLSGDGSLVLSSFASMIISVPQDDPSHFVQLLAGRVLLPYETYSGGTWDENRVATIADIQQMINQHIADYHCS